jgi:hypothetical protein
MYKRKPILQGTSDMDQLHKIFNLCGPPTPKSMPSAQRLPLFEAIKNMQYHRTLEGQHSRLVFMVQTLFFSSADFEQNGKFWRYAVVRVAQARPS